MSDTAQNAMALRRLERENKRLRADLDASLRQLPDLRNMIAYSGDALALLDAEGRITEANARLIALLGDPEAEVYGQAIARWMPVAGQWAVLAERLRQLQTGDTQRMEISIGARAATGRSPIEVELAAARLPESTGSGLWAVSLRDLGERRRLESSEADRAVLAHLNAELALQIRISEALERAATENATRIEAMSVELERRAVQAEAGNRTKTAFLAIMGHEFRTPINAIVGVAEALLPTLGGTRERELVHTQLGAARRLQSMVEDVLDLARAAGEDAPQREDFSPSRLLGELCERAQGRAPGVVLITEADTALPSWLSGDTPRISRVLRHYLDNALKVTREGSITLSVRRLRDDGEAMLRFEVRDTGPGIAPELRARLFRIVGPQEDYLRREHGGAGLGLALARQLSQILGGEAGCESEPGRGSTFWLTVPLVPARGGTGAVPVATDAPGAPVARDVQTMDREDFAAALGELRGMLGADDMRASRRFNELEPLLAAALPVEVMARLRAEVGAFDFASAHATLSMLDAATPG